MYNPPRRVAPWSIASQYMLDREEFSITPFQLASLMFCCWWSKLLFGQKNFGTEVWILPIRICSFCEQLCCISAFLCSATSVETVTSISNPFNEFLLVFWIRDVRNHHLLNVLTICSLYLQKLWRLRRFLKEFGGRSSVKHSGELSESLIFPNSCAPFLLWLKHNDVLRALRAYEFSFLFIERSYFHEE